jgi:hypothetical protein
MGLSPRFEPQRHRDTEKTKTENQEGERREQVAGEEPVTLRNY